VGGQLGQQNLPQLLSDVSKRGASPSERAPARVRSKTEGAPSGGNFREKTPTPDFKEEPEKGDGSV
jgi:hypothetical protein